MSSDHVPVYHLDTHVRNPVSFVSISHDHALGITRLNVYAGLVGFYILRDNLDSGLEGNPLGLPAGKYEHAYAIQVPIQNKT